MYSSIIINGKLNRTIFEMSKYIYDFQLKKSLVNKYLII